MTGSDLMALAREALTDPRRSGARFGAMQLPASVQAEALVLISVLSVLGIWVVSLLSGGGLGAEDAFLPMPFLLLAMQILAMLALATAVSVLGRLAKGQGDFAGSLRIVIWLQGLMVVVQAAQILLIVILPGLAGLVSLLAILAAGWVATGLIAGLHGFRSLPLTFLGMIGGIFVVAFVLSLLLAPFLPSPV